MFREALKTDLPQIAKIHSDAWHAAYEDLIDPRILIRVTPESRLSSWKEWFQAGNHNVMLLIEADEILGFIRTCPTRPVARPPAGYGEMTHLYLDPNIIAKGYGHQLFEQAKQMLANAGYLGMILWTIEGNVRARNFYENHGMKTDGARVDEPAWLGEGVYEIRYVLPF